MLRSDVSSVGLITAENVAAYVAELERLGNKNSTILARLEELTEMAKILDPKRDWIGLAAHIRQSPCAPNRPPRQTKPPCDQPAACRSWLRRNGEGFNRQDKASCRPSNSEMDS